MVRIYLPYVSSILVSITDLNTIQSGPRIDHLYTLFSARQALEAFLFSSIWKDSLRVCLGPGATLLNNLVTLTNGGPEEELSPSDVVQIKNAVSSFKTVLEAEFQTSSIYLVTPRRGYDIQTLLDSAEVIFPKELIEKVPDVLFDIREAGKCIAFDLGTAAGFHFCRALETVIAKYWNVVMDGKPLPTNRNIGQYISQMEKASVGDGKVLAALRQIKDNHRNELMHPEDKLDLDQAIALLGIVQSAIVAMLPTLPYGTNKQVTP